jgi:hypothetical protein
VIWKDEQVTVAPDVIDVDEPFRFAPDVPTVPVATTVVVSLLTSAKYAAVPVAAATPDVIALAVAVTVPPPAVAAANAVAPKVRVTRSVPVTAPLTEGWAPV